ncbi:hypothetical protein Ao3042_08636 [Aspergillus oryzae 3.042]|uniref:Uncharacterized protein n=1 Tax=Aspergillus oryzae (strain 3.042) TaxID=1160506 RepID=I8TKY0_ASPO3|nr:hypothetical protein Ao3042_08636 [Aspergillus oryzae 3.042]|eukprot:EIT74780.1 hypothetical protein Ao3042_08636 [Aspergillus oryzae 3.042]
MYKVSIATPTVQFGGNIRVTYRFVPLLKGLTVKSIRSGVIETHTVLRPYASRSREVLTDAFDPPTWEEMDISTDDRCWYQCSRMLHLPKSTRQCLQSVATTVLKPFPSTHPFIIFYPSTSASLQMLSDIATWDEEENTLPHYSDHVRDSKLVEICPGNPSTPAGPGSNEKPPDYSVSHDVSDIPSYWDTI